MYVLVADPNQHSTPGNRHRIRRSLLFVSNNDAFCPNGFHHVQEDLYVYRTYVHVHIFTYGRRAMCRADCSTLARSVSDSVYTGFCFCMTDTSTSTSVSQSRKTQYSTTRCRETNKYQTPYDIARPLAAR